MTSRFVMVGAAAGIVVVLTAASLFVNKLDTIIDLLKSRSSTAVVCSKESTCLKFKHESELVLPPVKMDGCEPYELPALETLPKPEAIEVPDGASDEAVVKLLLEYIEKVLDNDKQSKALLLKHYQDYLASCTAAIASDPASVKTK